MQLSERPAGLVLPERESQNADPRFLNGRLGCMACERQMVAVIMQLEIISHVPRTSGPFSQVVMLSVELPNIIGRNMTSFGI